MKCVFCNSETQLRKIGFLRYILGVMISHSTDWTIIRKIKKESGLICSNCLQKVKQDANDLRIMIQPNQFREVDYIGNGKSKWYFDIYYKNMFKIRHPELNKNHFRREVIARNYSEARKNYIGILMENI